MPDYNQNKWQAKMEEYDLFVGLDVDKRSISVTVRDKMGMGRSLTMPYDAQDLLSFIDNKYAPVNARFSYEAGPTGFGLHDAIVGAGYECLVVSPSNIPMVPNSRVKTNRLDSVKLAELLRGDQLRGIRVPGKAIRELRALVHLRYTYMQEIRAYKCRIKAELLKEGLQFPKAPKGSQWSQKVIQALRQIECSAVTCFNINSMLDHIEFASKQHESVELALCGHIKGDEELSRNMKHLMSCPGIGFRIACYTLSRIGDPSQLGKSKEMGSFLGLVPRENSTGDKTDRGSITKCGDPRLRSMLIQGAWTAIRRDSELKAFYDRVFSTHNHKSAARVAIVAVARKLAERMHCVLKEQRDYKMRLAA